MALTLTSMRALVRSRLDDDQYDLTYLDTVLNQAQWEILNNRNLSLLEKTGTITLLAGETSVDFPVDMRTPLSIRVTVSGQTVDITDYYMDYADMQQQNSWNTTGISQQPLYWTTFAGKFVVPVPADQNYTVTVDYTKTIPRLVNEADEFTIPEEFEELLMLGAFIKIAKQEDDFDVSNQEKIDYKDRLTDFVHAYSRNRGTKRKHIMRRTGR